jgi:hypothetical protein
MHHSSPLSVPGSARNATTFNVPSALSDLPAGTLPESPAPLQIALDMETADSSSLRSVPPTPMFNFAANAPMLTPMPGTNLSLDGFNPAIVVHSPPVNSTPQTSQEPPSYFDIPRNSHVSVGDGGNTTTNNTVIAAVDATPPATTSDISDSKHAPTSEQLIMPSLPMQPSKSPAVECTGDIVPRDHPRVDGKQKSESSDDVGNYDYRTCGTVEQTAW